MSEVASPPLTGYEIYDPEDPFENHVGPFWCAQLVDGSHNFVVRADERHCNSHGIVHGGFLMTMIDLTLVMVAKTEADDRLVTVSLNSEFVASARIGDLIEARGELTRRGRSLAFVRGCVSCGDRVLLTASAVLKPMGSMERIEAGQ
ncbi:MAG: PaaI family thioesterase [Paracoccaceae bacterium]